MRRQTIDITAKRAQLVAQAAVQRAALARQARILKAPLRIADQGVAAARTLGRHPLLVAGAAALFLAWRPRRALAWLQYGWMGWQMLRRLRGNLADNKTV
jgi:hypothetical protein